MKREGGVIRIGGEDVLPGQRRTVDLPIGSLYTDTEMAVPVHIVRGRRDGPVLLVSAAIHGDEILGVEILRRLLRLKMLSHIRGTLIAIPVVNVYGFVTQSRYLPDRRDLNRSFPGSERGSLTARLANLFMEHIVSVATHGIDLHSGSGHRTNLPQIRGSLEDPETERLARAFGVPVIIDAVLRDGSLREAAADRGIPMLLFEAGEALRFSEVAIRTGVRGIVSVMREIGMLSRKIEPRRNLEPLVARSTSWVRAPASGILYAPARLGARIKKGDVLGIVGDPFGNVEEKIVSQVNGMIIGRTNLPLTHEGDALFHVASVDRAAAVDRTLAEFHSGINETDFEEEAPSER